MLASDCLPLELAEQERSLLRNASQKAQADHVQVALDELDAGLRESINDVRELLVHFRTRTNTVDIETALQETLQKFKHQTGLVTHFHIRGEGLPLPADVQVQSEAGQGTTVVLSLPAHPVSGVNQGALNLDADVLAAMEIDSPPALP